MVQQDVAVFLRRGAGIPGDAKIVATVPSPSVALGLFVRPNQLGVTFCKLFDHDRPSFDDDRMRDCFRLRLREKSGPSPAHDTLHSNVQNLRSNKD
jgi:hypothetical protein